MYSRDDNINPRTNGKLSWRSVRSCTSYFGEALENWQNRMHEVSMIRCARITRYVRRVGTDTSDLPIYEGLHNLASFLTKFEEKVTEHQRLPPLDFALKSTPARWWVAHK